MEGEPKTFDLRKEHLSSCVYRGGEEGGNDGETGGGRWKLVLDALVKGLDGGEKEDEEVKMKREAVLKVSLRICFPTSVSSLSARRRSTEADQGKEKTRL